MTNTVKYDSKTTALLCIDFYNDFLSEGGKLWPWEKDMAEELHRRDGALGFERLSEHGPRPSAQTL